VIGFRLSTFRRGRWNCGTEMSGNFAKCRLSRYIYGSITCHKATTWDRRLYFPSEERRAEDFFALKTRRLRLGANPLTWVPKASTLPIDHRSRLCTYIYIYIYMYIYIHICVCIAVLSVTQLWYYLFVCMRVNFRI